MPMQGIRSYTRMIPPQLLNIRSFLQDDVPTPPGGTLSNGTACVTKMASITLGFRTDIIPLSYTLLSTDSSTNNIGSFPGGV